MSRWAGVIRDADGLDRLLRAITEAGDGPGPGARLTPLADHDGRKEGRLGVAAASVLGRTELDTNNLELAAVEAANLRTVSLLIAAGALRRAESRGCHRRRDAARTAAAPWHTLARWDGRELVLSTEEEL